MNKVVLCGNVANDPEVRYTSGANSVSGEATCIARYTLAVSRRNRDQEPDWIRCVAFGKAGEFADKYIHKGMKILVYGRIQTSSYTNKEGMKMNSTEVVVEEHEFCERRQNAPESRQSAPGGFTNQTPAQPQTTQQGFMEVADEGLPWS